MRGWLVDGKGSPSLELGDEIEFEIEHPPPPHTHRGERG